MRFNVSSWSIRHPSPAILLFVLLTVLGAMAFPALPVQDFPDVDLPRVSVTASLPGASPSQLETEVARKLEDALATVPGLKHQSTTLTDGSAEIALEFRLEIPTAQALDDVRDVVSRVRGDLPADLRDPVIKRVEVVGGPLLTYTVTARDPDTEALSWFIDNEAAKALLAVPGVGEVKRVGGVDREVRVTLDPRRLMALNTTAAEISRRLRETQQDGAGGRVDLGGTEQSIRAIGTVRTAAEIGAIELALGDGRRVRLDQVATVADTVAEPRTAALVDGRPAVGLQVMRARGFGELDVAEGVRRAMARLRADHPELRLVETLDFTDQIVENHDGSMRLLLEGAALAVLVVFVFLRDARATAIAAAALPLSVIPTFALMHAMGFTLNTVTLLSLSLVVGVLVDDAIVEIENIERHLLMGKTPYQAAMEAADEIGLAVIATTLTLVAVFLPTAFMSGTVGRFFVQFGWTAAGAVLCSLVVARLLTPMMAAYLLRPPKREANAEPVWVSRYLVLARWCLRRRAVTVAAATAFLAVGLGVAVLLPTTFIPADDGIRSEITITLPPGSPLAATVASAEQARTLVATHPQVRGVFTAIGVGGTGGDGPGDGGGAGADVRTAVLTLTLAPRADRPRGLTQQRIEADLRERLAAVPGVRVKVGQGGSGDSYLLALSGDDPAALERHAQRVERELRALPGVGAVQSTASLARPELRVRTDFARAGDLGVSSSAIAETLRVATVGDYAQSLAKLNLGERQVPVRVRLDDSAREDLGVLRRLPVPGARGPVALEHVASLELDSGPVEIQRRDRRRTVTLEVEAGGRPLGEIEREALALPSLKDLPRGIALGALGDAEEMEDMTAGFAMAMVTGVLCIYLVLALLLDDFVQPLTLLIALVLSLPGAMLALWVTGSSLSMPSMIGLIMLMGVATKNSILLVDYIVLARRDHGLPRAEALVDACRKRARPIVMTTIAMGAGMLPVALGLVGDPSFRVPMAIVVIGGLLSSTALSLLVIPVVYSLVDDLIVRVKKAFA
ncbi:efflux RND transporter permease subunit [Mitsuaria sp. GD03876]|uniref:efflux RND transporter permease subunit n=1 Tax=Mitsuaria sp. GD03876 TaxID=2975399 RepID=UPI00244AE19E|nr:efflux RND transporter permease subunit [Mitsuaria sp. GD03876]MDH0864697.1 efflux RND transporter permease subunit [Mitsuaria sp. GD03876]